MMKRFVLLLALMPFAACATDTPEHHGPIVRDSAGIRIVENTTPQWQEGREWRLSEKPLVDIGGGDTEEDQLFRVRGAVRLSDGKIVVANGGTNELRFYSAHGEHIASAGGQGGGPGEFRGLWWIGRYRGDSLIAFDQLQGRISVFDDLGQLGRTVTIRSQGEGAPPNFLNISGVWGDGSMLLFSYSRNYFFGTKGPLRFQNALARYGPDGVLIDSLGIHPGLEAVGIPSGPSTVYFYVPFSRTTDYVVYDDGFYVASNDTYTIERYDLTGNLKALVRKDYELVQPTDTMIEGVLTTVLGDSPSPGMRRLADEAMEMAPHETIPAFGKARATTGYPQVVVDDLANLWVLEIDPFGASSPRWSIFNPEGFLFGTLVFPRSFRPLDIGSDYALGVWRDADDVEHVQLYDLIKPGQ